MCGCMHNHIQFHATPWAVTHQAPLSMEFFKQEYWSGLPFPTPVDGPNPGIKPVSLASPALAGEFFTTSATWEAPNSLRFSSVQSLSHVQLLATPWTAAHQASMNTSFKFLLGRDDFLLCILQISLNFRVSQH